MEEGVFKNRRDRQLNERERDRRRTARQRETKRARHEDEAKTRHTYAIDGLCACD